MQPLREPLEVASPERQSLICWIMNDRMPLKVYCRRTRMKLKGSPSLGDVTSERPLQLVANRSLAALQLGESLERCATV